MVHSLEAKSVGAPRKRTAMKKTIRETADFFHKLSECLDIDILKYCVQSNHCAASRVLHAPVTRVDQLDHSRQQSTKMKVYVISDVHSDYPENLEWVKKHCAATSRPHDILIVAGDVSDDLSILRETLEPLTTSYGQVFYTPGNHELWVRRAERGQYDSLTKLHKIQDLCNDLGVHTAPVKLPSGIWIVPIWSWYHADWDKELDIPNSLSIEKVMMDYHACSWTSEPTLKASGDDSLAQYFDALNDPNFKNILSTIQEEREAAKKAGNGKLSTTKHNAPVVISFSHFLPFQELLPEKRMLHYPNLAKAAGSDYLGARVAALSPDCHIFGHTHFTQDQTINNTRFVQWPLGYPRDQKMRRDGGAGWEPLAVWDTEAGGATAERRAYWSDYYRNNKRAPHIVNPAPWVVG